MGAFSDLMLDRQEDDDYKKRRNIKQEMIDFIYIYDQSVSKEEMNTWTLEKIRNKYRELKRAREKRLEREYQENRGVTKKRRNYL